ncbi:hypothetical protein MMC20_003675 [Loxospora ochrophaea]|nr:hypothetical protein [Loxospora ochrophaea]
MSVSDPVNLLPRLPPVLDQSLMAMELCDKLGPSSYSSTSTQCFSEGEPTSSASELPSPERKAFYGTTRTRYPTKYQAWKYLDIKEHIPLGSLTLEPEDPYLQHYNVHDDWTESLDVLEAIFEKSSPYGMLHLLLQSELIRVFTRRHQEHRHLITIRIFALPDDVGRRYLPRDDKRARAIRTDLVRLLDKSMASWNGYGLKNGRIETYAASSEEDDSLFFIFNTLQSPSPEPAEISDVLTRNAMQRLLWDSPAVTGLSASLYPYQRRSAAMMIRRESEPLHTLDPRFEVYSGPTEQKFYHDSMGSHLFKDRRVYDEARGGILAETMGFGKTLICLAVILSTKGHWAQIPPEYVSGLPPVRESIGSLMQMAAATIGRVQRPWHAYFEQLSRRGEYYEKCVETLKAAAGSYVIHGRHHKQNLRKPSVRKGNRILLSSTTLVIVPPNLIMQWRKELEMHVDKDALSVKSIDQLHEALPSAEELVQYDMVLISKQRFEREIDADQATLDRWERSRTKSKVCTCPSEGTCCCVKSGPYRSPLQDMHFLRIIVDEGHDFASSGSQTNAVHLLKKLHFERRWIVSGTPSNGLLGVEVGMAADETWSNPLDVDLKTKQISALQKRRHLAVRQERKDLESLGHIVVDFLGLKPWANAEGEDTASWTKYIVPTKDGQRKPKSLRSALQGLVVRHRIEDIEADLSLPPLYNSVVHLEPCFFDKLSINLFLLSLAANAVTSERVDQDYMFHPQNRRQLDSLITNLRQSGFYWTGFTAHDITETLRISRNYLEQQLSSGGLVDEDRDLLESAIDVGSKALDSPAWTVFGQLHELGLYVSNFPVEARDSWSLLSGRISEPLLVGVTQLRKAQQFVDSHLYAPNPIEGLAAAGVTAMETTWTDVDKSSKKGNSSSLLNMNKNKGIPSSSVASAPAVRNKSTKSPIKPQASPKKRVEKEFTAQSTDSGLTKNLKSALKSSTQGSDSGPFSDPFLAKTELCGTASAKLSYLLDRVVALQRDEKILIFYEGEHIAYYIAQALEIIDVQFLIYAKSLQVARRNTYITTFNTTETFRVLLMDLRHAAHGLHVASASRVFFVNPVWQPNVEAQAIKRAHRIGQSRPVYVETLVLRDTLEDLMLQRRKAMTAQEHQQAEKSLLDDSRMGDIIRDATFIPISGQEASETLNQMAPLNVPQRIFARGSGKAVRISDPDADLVLTDDSPPRATSKGKKRKAVFIEGSDPTPGPAHLEQPQAEIYPRTLSQAPQDTCTTAPMTKKPKKTARFVDEVPNDSAEDLLTQQDPDDSPLSHPRHGSLFGGEAPSLPVHSHRILSYADPKTSTDDSHVFSEP